jgi:hypothetical protein
MCVWVSSKMSPLISNPALLTEKLVPKRRAKMMSETPICARFKNSLLIVFPSCFLEQIAGDEYSCYSLPYQ